MSTHATPDAEHIDGCSMWHHQGGDYDRDCPACMTLAEEDQKAGRWTPRTGVSMYEAADPIGQWTKRGPGTAEVIELREIEVQPGERVCQSCWLVHRPGTECP
ncbi:hypothetical protein I5G59_gp76 [Mycobacterium phage LilMcDreamy]|uniref:Uncharacterized protein n=1 Tax=Mycobacterium phage LilMcDreamy TaxID=2652422 RepID=A0A5P8D6Q1_9CAUD|nr:hypothetical protein I5G59_gp76 [Mycobacterium phage LilMcDreamy]QFP94696.1 hypothetical protein SEA_LILMCDREAMY_76 [Mycobacterium phage LilMcDreamy]